MAGLIARLFGGQVRPPDPDPLPGLGGYDLPPGPTGAGGYPGSTSATRTFKSKNPRGAKVNADTNSGANNALGTTVEVRQVSYRGDQISDGNPATANPRLTPDVTPPQTYIRQRMQTNSSREFYGGPRLHTGPGNNVAGGNPLSPAAMAGGESVRDTETPATRRQPVIGVGTPGSQNVRNQIAQRYKNVPGQSHTYKSRKRVDAPAEDVTVQNRFVFPGGGNTTWSVLREMPYAGRGNGARGADLNGQRYYATGQSDQFWNSGQGDYGIARQRGGRRPVSFTEPAPWSSNFYDTTDSVGTANNPGVPTQAPNMVYVSPTTGRNSQNTGRGL